MQFNIEGRKEGGKGMTKDGTRKKREQTDIICFQTTKTAMAEPSNTTDALGFSKTDWLSLKFGGCT